MLKKLQLFDLIMSIIIIIIPLTVFLLPNNLAFQIYLYSIQNYNFTGYILLFYYFLICLVNAINKVKIWQLVVCIIYCVVDISFNLLLFGIINFPITDFILLLGLATAIYPFFHLIMAIVSYVKFSKKEKLA